MSPTKLKSLLTGAFFAIIIALASSVVAGDLRFFSPYTCQSFGGGRRGHDGVYGSLTGIYWSFSAPRGGYIGATTSGGHDESRRVWDGTREFTQTNSARINMMSPTTTLGTRFEVGNRRGHHGWLVSGYGLPSQGHSMNLQNVSMVIRDEGNMSILTGNASLADFVYVWDRDHNSLLSPRGMPDLMFPAYAAWQRMDRMQEVLPGLGFLWGYFDYAMLVGEDEPEMRFGIFAPVPIVFQDVDINVRSTHRSGELMYTYRPHPFTWGSMELLAGARYWDFNDTFGFSGINWADIEEMDDPTSGLIVQRTGLRSMVIDAEGRNRIFGPQIGIKLHRHNARWTFGAEGRFTGGINAQTIRTRGHLEPRTSGHYPPPGTEPGGMWGPIGLQNSNTHFGHRQNKTYFSPILEGRLSADWQWTSAVSFFGAVNGMFAGNIARGYRLTDYVVHSDGTIFGIRGNDRNTHVFVYGAEMGIRFNR